MTSIHKSKESTESDGLYKLLLQTGLQTIGDDLFTKLITKEEKEIKMRTRRKRKFLINN